MSLSISPMICTVMPGTLTTFTATGGTAPYVFTIVSGGVGGSVGSSSGVYTAPAAAGVDTVRVTDSALVPDTASAVVTVRSHLELLCDVIQHELGLADGRVYAAHQKINSPSDFGLFVAIAEMNPKVFGVTSQYVPGLGEVQSVNIRSQLDINIISRDTSALNRKEEVVMALASLYSQSSQEKNSFRIFPVPGAILNLSGEDGSAIPYRYVFSVAIQYFKTKTKTADYYDNFEEPPVEITVA